MTPPPLIVEWHIGGVLYGDDFCQRAYALCMLIDLAAHASEGYLPTKEIAQRKETSEKRLESILKSSVKGGIRGKGGGYKLTMAAMPIV